jgi:hypothetical protein
MPIRKHLTDKRAFGPAAIEAMSKAFEEACIALQVYAGDEKGREIIATRIIDLARSGLVDATALRDRVLSEAQQAIEQPHLGSSLKRTKSSAKGGRPKAK